MQEHWNRMGATLAVAASLALAACGGGGGGGDSDGGGGAPGGGGGGGGTSGQVATVTYGAIPGYDALHSVVQVAGVTNRGLYIVDSNAQGGHRVHKLHGSPAFSNAWSTADFGAESAFDVVPSNAYTERDREFSFWYQNTAKVAQYNANNGAPSFEWENDMTLQVVTPGPLQGTFTGPWGLGGSINRDYLAVYLDDNMYTGSRKVSDMFTTPVAPLAYQGADRVLGRPDDLELFVADGRELRVYSGSGLKSTETIPGSGFGWVTDMTWYDGALWFAIDNKVYRRNGPGSFTVKAEMDYNPTSAALDGRFCIKGGEILMPDGIATSISTGQRRSYLSRGTLTTAQQTQLALLQASLVQVYCSPANSSATIYASPDVLQPGKIRMIDIVQGV